MGRKKKISLKLNPDWMFNDPLDFEYNKYTLLGYLQKCEKEFDRFEIYPNFVELSLHLANIQSLGKENTLLLTNKQFTSYDDEILLKDLYPQKPRPLTTDEIVELDKTIRYSGGKLFDAFNIAKSLWNIGYDSIEINLKHGKKNLDGSIGFVFHKDVLDGTYYVWEYLVKTDLNQYNNSNITLKKLYVGNLDDTSIKDVILTKSKSIKKSNIIDFPIFEAKSDKKFPIDQTLLPIIKRKILAFFYQHRKVDKISSGLTEG